MDGTALDPASSPGSRARNLLAPLAGLGGCLFLVVDASRERASAGQLPFLDTARNYEPHGLGWWYLVVPVVATVAGLLLLRWWPYLLAVAGLLSVPGTWQELARVPVHIPLAVDIIAMAGYPLALLGVLACAQGLVAKATGWGAAIAGLAVGARLFGLAILGAEWLGPPKGLATPHAVLTAAGFVAVLPVLWRCWRGDRAADGPAGRGSWPRLRPVVAGGLAACLVIPLSFLTPQRLAALLGVSPSAIYRHQFAETAVIGAVTLVIAAGLAAMVGVWSLGGALTSATAHVAVVAPMLLAVAALAFREPTSWLGGLAGVVVGGIVAANRVRIPLAGALAVVTATALFIAYGATTGHPEKLADQRSTIPGLLIIILVTAVATAVVGATAPVLAPRGALPAVLGPLTATLAGGGLQTVEVTYLQDGEPVSSYLNPVLHLNTSAVLLLAVGAAIGGLGFAQQIAARRAERKHTEQIRREAAEAERDRLARPIHDGVLQVLALVQRRGSELGEPGSELAALAGEQEVALRNLLSGGTATRRGAREDLRTALITLASPAIEVATPAQPVVLPAGTVAELTVAVRAALDNVRRHAGPGAHAWVLLEDEQDAVRVTVRDDGVGFPPERLAEAAEAGRLGVAQSMRGRIADLGGTTEISSRPGDGTEVEFRIPRK